MDSEPKYCDVEGCKGRAIADVFRFEDGNRCRSCLEYDLGMRSVS